MFTFWKKSKSPAATAEPQTTHTISNQNDFAALLAANPSGEPVVTRSPQAATMLAQPRSEKISEPLALEIVASLMTDAGCRRKVNEDSSRYIRPFDDRVLIRKGILALVADGVGGHSAGEIASRMATDVIHRVYYDDAADRATALDSAFHAANHEIFQAALKDESLYNMGTTCTALVLCDGTALWAHVGDSRLYLVRDGEIQALTEDHSAVMALVKLGLITPEEARHHAEKNVILRALGVHPHVEVEVCDAPLPIKAGDKFLLCSDGLYDLVRDQEIKRAVMHKTPQAACESLITLAKERGGFDNITVAIFSIEAKSKTESVRARRMASGV